MIVIDENLNWAFGGLVLRDRSELRISVRHLVLRRSIGHDLVNLGIHAPFDVFGNRGAFLLLLQTLEDFELGLRLVLTS